MRGDKKTVNFKPKFSHGGPIIPLLLYLHHHCPRPAPGPSTHNTTDITQGLVNIDPPREVLSFQTVYFISPTQHCYPWWAFLKRGVYLLKPA